MSVIVNKTERTVVVSETRGPIGPAGPTGPIGATDQRYARYVMTTNVANLAAFTVLQDGVTGVAGDDVLLCGQTTKSENGIYTLGTVAAGVAPLTRSTVMPAGQANRPGTKCAVSEGTFFQNTDWKITTTGSITIGTTAHDWYPGRVSFAAPLTNGTRSALGFVPLLHASKTNILYTCPVPIGIALTVSYQTVPPLTPGVVGTASAIPQACLANGAINASDQSTIVVTIINW